MPDQIQPSPQFDDDLVRLSVDPPDSFRPTIRLRAAAAGCGAVVDLSAVGAQTLSALLASAVTAAVGRALPTEPEGGDTQW